MAWSNFVDDIYRTKRRSIPWYASAFPSLTFHCRFLRMVLQAGAAARRGNYNDQRWIADSVNVLRELENVGVEFEISGTHYFEELAGPCLFIGNHMSTLETAVLPGLIQPTHPVTFVVKSTLLKYPVFKHILRSRDPIVVDRLNPREDFQRIMKGGLERLTRGISIVIFPQAHRMSSFDPAHFNKIGVKLAARANVPVIPLALQTDAWQTGIFRTDFGRIIPTRRVRFAFGAPMIVPGRGHAEQRAVCEFIGQKMLEWDTASHGDVRRKH